MVDDRLSQALRMAVRWLNFPSGFGADYGMSVEGGFWGAFDILNTPGNFTFKAGAGQGGNNSPTFTLTLNQADAALLGIKSGFGQTFNFLGTLTSKLRVPLERSHRRSQPASRGQSGPGFDRSPFKLAARIRSFPSRRA